MKAILLAALVTFAAAPLVVAETPAASQPKPASTNAPSSVTLGFLETQDRSVEIKSGKTGTYTVRTKEGKVLAENITASQLQAQFPGLDQIVRGVARDTHAKSSVYRSASWNTDASVNITRSATWNNDASVRH